MGFGNGVLSGWFLVGDRNGVAVGVVLERPASFRIVLRYEVWWRRMEPEWGSSWSPRNEVGCPNSLMWNAEWR